jgi:Methyltransferase domain
VPAMPEPMENEFGIMAKWAHEAARVLGPRYAVPAACRGSGTPAALDWLLERLGPEPTSQMLDMGAGLGGPAAYARARVGVRPVCFDPMRDACEAAAALFGLPAVVGDAARLPFGERSFGAAWSLGTLCTTRNKSMWLAEMRRVLNEEARLGLLVVVSTAEAFATRWGNEFPSAEELAGLLSAAGFTVVDQAWSSDCPDADASWHEAERAVGEAIRRRHAQDPRYGRVMEQETRMTELVDTGRVRGRLVVARAG